MLFQIDKLRAAGDTCTCPTPCVNTEYVPTTSFSIIMGPETSNAQDEETFALQQKLSKARETRYRVVQDKYLQTMRQLHIVDRQLTVVRRFVEATSFGMHSERDFISVHTAQINDDCMNVGSLMQRVKRDLIKSIKTPIEMYLSLLESRGRLVLEELSYIIDDLLDLANRYQHNPKNIGELIGDSILKFFNKSSQVTRGDQVDDLTWNEYVSTTLAPKNTTIWTKYITLLATLTSLKGDEHSRLMTAINTISPSSEFRLEKSRLEPLMKYISDHCNWCSFPVNSTFVETVQTRILSHLDTSLSVHITTATASLQRAFEEYLSDILVKDNLRTISGWADPDFYLLLNTSRLELESARHKLTLALEDIEEAIELIADLVHFTWHFQCQTQLTSLIREYKGYDLFLDDILKETLSILKDQQAVTVNLWKSYIDSNSTLESVARTVPFSAMTDVIANRELRIDTILNDRWMSIYNIHNHIKSIGYTFMSVVDDRHLANSAAYWQAFGITKPSTSLGNLVSTGGNAAVSPDFHMVTNEAESKSWATRRGIISTIRQNLNVQAESLRNEVDISQKYFTEYIQDIELGDDFYE